MNKKILCGGAAAAIAFMPLFATDIENSPATQKGLSQPKQADEQVQNSPAMKAQNKGSSAFPSKHHENAYNSLSGKNKKVYDSLEKSDQDKLADTHKKGGNAQKTLSDILATDQKNQKSKETNSGDKFFWDKKKDDKKLSPAEKAMSKKGKEKDSDGIFD